MKVIRSPIVYEAELFHSKGNIPSGVYERLIPNGSGAIGCYWIPTPQGNIILNDGEWVVKDIHGFIGSYSEEEFRRIFEMFEND